MNNLIALSFDDHLIVLPAGTDMKLKILHAVNEPLGKMTVEGICKNCGISRSTFYHHFNSKYSMQPWFITTAMESTIDRVGRSKTWAQGFSSFLHFLSLEADFNRHAAQEWTPHSSLREHRQSAIVKTLEEYKNLKIDDGMRALINFYVDSEAQLCVNWFKGQIGLDFSELHYLFNSCVPQRLHDAMEYHVHPRDTHTGNQDYHMLVMQS